MNVDTMQLKPDFFESINGVSINEKKAFNIYIGKNVPQSKEDIDLGRIRTILDEEIEQFFLFQTQFTGYTRLQAKGKWTSQEEPYGVTYEDSEMVTVFNATLKEVCDFALSYIVAFGQEAIYVDILESTQVVINLELFENVASN